MKLAKITILAIASMLALGNVSLAGAPQPAKDHLMILVAPKVDGDASKLVGPALVEQLAAHAVVLDGTIDYSLTSVGELSVSLVGHGAEPIRSFYCTASLIDQQAILTAAHCVDYRSGQGRAGDRFIVSRLNGRSLHTESFGVAAYKSLGSVPGAADLAIAALSRPVPNSIAVPIALSATKVATSVPAVVLGYGCIERETGVGAFTKRRAAITWPLGPNHPVLCKGDSGGPVLIQHNTGVEMVAVNSAYWEDPNDRLVAEQDIFAEVVTHGNEIRAAVASLLSGPPQTSTVPVLNPSPCWDLAGYNGCMSDCESKCAKCEGEAGCAGAWCGGGAEVVGCRRSCEGRKNLAVGATCFHI